MFYLTNLLFSLIMLYAMHHFSTYDNKENPNETQDEGRGSHKDSVLDAAFLKNHFLKNGDNTSMDQTESARNIGDASGYILDDISNE